MTRAWDLAKVVVGVDGSPQSRLALRWAAAEAVRRRARLHVVHAYAAAWQHVAARPERAAETADGADRVFVAAFDDVQCIAPDLVVTSRAVPGGAAKALLAAANRGGLVVVGNNGHSEVAALLAGSTCQQVAAHADGPVVVVRGRAGYRAGPVVVGYDGSTGAATALEYAFDAAASRRCRLAVIRAIPPGPWTAPSPGDPERAARIDELRRLAAPVATTFPDVAVQYRVSDGNPTDVLVDASYRACLLVVGSRGHGGFVGLLLGSVGQRLLHHSHCPVLIGR